MEARLVRPVPGTDFIGPGWFGAGRAAPKNAGETFMAASKNMDAVALLKADHRKVEELFEKFESARGAKEKIAQQICMELIIHTTIEEEIFYPACTGQVEDENLVQEAYVEHDSAKVLI